MIVHRKKRGWLLITQPAHAWLAGELASLWGNETFVAPTPFDAVVLSTRLHDIGWLDWDASPRLGKDGRPVGFLDTTLAETIPIWRQAVQQVSLLDPYAALLVSKHASTIFRRRMERKVDPPEMRSKVEAVQAEHRAVQEAFRSQLAGHPAYGTAVEPDRLNAAYRWLRVCDLLSLALCVQQMPSSGVIEAVQRIDPLEFTNIHYSLKKPFELQLDPSPFANGSLQLIIQTRYLKETIFPTQAAYVLALEQAPWVPQAVTINAV